MKVTFTHTKFEFSSEEGKAIETVYSLLDSICNNMDSEDLLFDHDKYDISCMANFFEQVISVLHFNEGFIETN